MKRLRRFISHNLGWKALSVLLALALWIGIAREPEMATSISLPLLLRNVPEPQN